MDTSKQLSHKETALITGASSGIGADIARELAALGYDLVLTARRTDRLEALKSELEKGGATRVQILSEDLAAPGGAASLIRRVAELGTPISFLVNNAGFGLHGDFLGHDQARLDQMLQLNMATLTTLTWHFGREMKKRGRGRIMQLSSIGAFQPSPYYSAYSATKVYVLYLSEAVNYELRGSGVSVTTVCPGLTATEFHDVAEHPKTGLAALTLMQSRPVARMAVAATLRGRAVLTPGILNKLTAFFVKLLPRSWVTAVGGIMMKN